MLKAIGMIGLFSSFCGIGVLAGIKLRERVQLLSEFQRIVLQFQIHTQYTHSDIFNIMRTINNSEESNILRRMLEIESVWNKSSIKEAVIANDDSDREIMLDFFRNIGASDLNGQTAVCKKALKQVAINLAAAKSDMENKGKVYKSLGFCTGLAAVIFFI